ncbi:MAG: hypothetical protein IPO23_12880 [Flavobacterium sp.]|nr:hypothetical protein [Flavobacterium sp.]
MKQKYLFFILAAVLALFVALLYVDFQQQSAHENPKDQILLRKIGDELLRSSEDSTSKVLARYKGFRIQVSNSRLKINRHYPDTLVAIVQRNLHQSSFSTDYAYRFWLVPTTKVVCGFVHGATPKQL